MRGGKVDSSVPPEVQAVLPKQRKVPARTRRAWRSALLAAIGEMSAESAAESMAVVRNTTAGGWERIEAAERVQGLVLRALLALDLRRLPGADTEPLVRMLERAPDRALFFSAKDLAKLRNILANVDTACESTLDPKGAAIPPSSRVSLVQYLLGVGGDFSKGASSAGSYVYDSSPTHSSSKKPLSIHSLPSTLDPTTLVRVERKRRAEAGSRRGEFRLPAVLDKRLRVARRIVMDVARGHADEETTRLAAMILHNTNPFVELLDRQKEPERWAALVRPSAPGVARKFHTTEGELHWLFGSHIPEKFSEVRVQAYRPSKRRARANEVHERLRPFAKDLVVTRMECGGCQLYHPPSMLLVRALPVRPKQVKMEPRRWPENRRVAEEVMLAELERWSGVRKPWVPSRNHGRVSVERKMK